MSWVENYFYGYLNTGHMAPQNKPLVHTMQTKPSRREEAGPVKRWTGQGQGQGERKSDKLQLRRQGALGCWGLVGHRPPHS